MDATFKNLLDASKKDSDQFWASIAERITWQKKWDTVQKWQFTPPVSIEWYLGGKLNAAYNCVDRHADQTPEKVAFYWEPDDPKAQAQVITYGELKSKVIAWAHALKTSGVKAGDRVTIYMPMIPDAVYSMLACARIGAPHSVVFGGFSADAIADRISDNGSEFILTADEGRRGGKSIPLKENVDQALSRCPGVKKVIVVKHTGGKVSMNASRDQWLEELTQNAPKNDTLQYFDSEHPLFLLYTSGSTNKPKGVLHTTGGYLTYAAYSHELVFNHKPNDVYWCAADIGWVTGHSYIVYGPLANGATSVLFEGLPNFPTPSRVWEVIDKYQVSLFYTAPTAIRALRQQGDEWVTQTSRKSLRVLGSVGEPINPEAWNWYYSVVGQERSPIVDTWWQTETGGILISATPETFHGKPGSATQPLPGIEPVVVDDHGKELSGAAEGKLCIRSSWPGQMRTVYGHHQRFEETYFATYPGYYFSGDGVRRDRDGDYWITGRVDDVLNVSGHRLGTAEIESALVAHPAVAEAAVVGIPHEIKGQAIVAFVTLKTDQSELSQIEKNLIQWVRKQISPIATPERIVLVPGLPKTRSGKIMRRILRKISHGELDSLGDTSTLADPSVVDQIVDLYKTGTP